MKKLCFVTLAVLLVACGGGGGGGAGDPINGGGQNTTLLLTLPEPGLQPAQLALLVAEGDALSEQVAEAYRQARGVPAANVIRVPGLNTAQHDISAASFATARAFIQARLGSDIQALLVTWAAPSRVVGTCRMGITSALAFGYDTAYCGSGPATTRASPYFDSESLRPQTDFGMRPAMMLGATTLAAAQALIQRGQAADNSQPAGTGYLVRTTDPDRNVRAGEFDSVASSWTGVLQIDSVNQPAGNAITGRSDVLFYLTGLTRVSGLDTLGFRPGAAADHLTSAGGFLPDGAGQMPITRWLEAGATASYGTVEEPFSIGEKFPRASVLIDQYWRGSTLIEAYWKSVHWPGQGLFIGEPLARPFATRPRLTIENNQYRLQSKTLRADTRYALEYQGASGSWIELGNVSARRGQAVDVRWPLAPAAATRLRWRGPCPSSPVTACTLAESP
jgi:uncharacterized protein (TIGR03790 family)